MLCKSALRFVSRCAAPVEEHEKVLGRGVGEGK